MQYVVCHDSSFVKVGPACFIAADEKTGQGMHAIAMKLMRYVPSAEYELPEAMTHIWSPDGLSGRSIKLPLEELLVGGDELTARNLNATIGGVDETGTLNPIMPLFLDWHAVKIIWDDLWPLIYDHKHLREDGTLYKIATSLGIDKVLVRSKPSKDRSVSVLPNLNARSDFLSAITQSEILARAFKVSGTTSVKELDDLLVSVAVSSKAGARALILNISKLIYDKYVKDTYSKETLGSTPSGRHSCNYLCGDAPNAEPCRETFAVKAGRFNLHAKHHHDSNHFMVTKTSNVWSSSEYHRNVLWYGLLGAVWDHKVKIGDGFRIVQVFTSYITVLFTILFRMKLVFHKQNV